MKFEVAEVNVVRATDGTFIVRTLNEQGVGEITTSPDFNGLQNRLNELFIQTAKPIGSLQPISVN